MRWNRCGQAMVEFLVVAAAVIAAIVAVRGNINNAIGGLMDDVETQIQAGASGATVDQFF